MFMKDLEFELKKLNEEIEKIKARNKRVEADKAWELSRTRAIFIAVSTYVLIYFFMRLINDDHPSFNALIASVGYLISTSTYGFIKSFWLKRRKVQ